MFALEYSLVQYAEFCLRIIVACVCGGIIGYEREKNYKDAGLRTHIIVCCSAALMMIVSKYGFSDLYRSGSDYLLGTKGADPARIAAQVISGVSFIGAGVIFHNKNNTKGLTTASGLWAIAGVGIAIGSGMYGLGVFSTILIAVIQTFIHGVSVKIGQHNRIKLEITAVNSIGVRRLIDDYLKEETVSERDASISIDGEYITYSLLVEITSVPDTDFINDLFEKSDSIKSVKYEQIS